MNGHAAAGATATTADRRIKLPGTAHVRRFALDRTGMMMVLIVAGPVLAFAGAAGRIFVASGGFGLLSGILLALGLLLMTASVAAGHRIERLPRLAAVQPDAPAHIAALRAMRLKTASLLLHLLALAAILLMGFGLLFRMNVVDAPASGDIWRRGMLVVLAGIALTQASAQWNAYATARSRPIEDRRTVLVLLGLGIAMVLTLLAGFLVLAGSGGNGLAGLDAGDAPGIALAAATAAALALSHSRGLPTLASILAPEHTGDGTALVSRNRAVFLPIFIAFGLLMVVFLLFILFGVGVVGLFGKVASDPIMLGSLLLVVVASGLSLSAAMRLARSEPLETPLFKKKSNANQRRENLIIGSSISVAALLAVPAVLLWSGQSVLGLPTGAWIQFFCFSILAAIGPYGFHAGREHKRVRLLEERFPDFLRDIASSHKGGLTLAQATAIAARGEYGPLTPEVKKMADQLSWNVPFTVALEQFAERVRTPLVRRAISLILQANKSGGATTDVLLAAARDAREIKSLENERKLSMGLYTVVIYITFFVFLGVAAILYANFVPQLVEASEAAAAQSSAGGLSGVKGVGGEVLRLQDFQLFYFMAAVMQGLGDGVVAGLMGNGRVSLGLRHSFLMVLLSYLTFAVFLT